MKVITYGTHGSIAVGFPNGEEGLHTKFGVNTTCLRIKSDCIPKGWAFAIDGGSGLLPLCRDLDKEEIEQLAIAFTHYHDDHTTGVPMSPFVHRKGGKIRMWGPDENGVGPEQILRRIFCPPRFPVPFAKVRHRFECKTFKEIGTQVLVIHPKAGFHLMPIDIYRRCEQEGKQISFRAGKYGIEECLVVFMYRTKHPEQTVSYRFEEKPTGRIFVFLTDHEVTESFSQEMLAHVKGAHLLIQDGQYSEEQYHTWAADFGHGTPQYCAKTMVAAGAERLGITHHHPGSSDADIMQRVIEATHQVNKMRRKDLGHNIFACADFQEHVV